MLGRTRPTLEKSVNSAKVVSGCFDDVDVCQLSLTDFQFTQTFADRELSQFGKSMLRKVLSCTGIADILWGFHH